MLQSKHIRFKNMSCDIEKVGFVQTMQERIITLENWCTSPLGHGPRTDPASWSVEELQSVLYFSGVCFLCPQYSIH